MSRSSGPSAPSEERPALRRLALAACFGILFVVSFRLGGGAFPIAELDPSWQAVLAFASRERLQFGTDLVFTAGPLGHLFRPYGLGAPGASYLVFALLSSAYAALTGTMLVRDLSIRVPLLLVLLVYAASHLESLVFAVILFAGCLMATRRALWADAVLIAWLGVLAQVKFSYGVAVLAMIATVVAGRLVRRDVAGGGRLVLLAVAAWLGTWTLAGQALGNLPAYWTNGLEISRGYNEAMSRTPPPGVLEYAVTALALAGVAGLVALWSARRDPVAITILAQIAVLTALAWKQGFVRADNYHMMIFLYFLPVALALLFHPRVSRTSARRTRRALLAAHLALTACALLAVDAMAPGTPAALARELPRRLADRAGALRRAIARAPDSERRALKDDPRVRDEDRLPRIADEARDHPVDVFHHRQAAAILNGLNYRPRPVIQSYAAYTPRLQELNLAFYRSAARPRYVLLAWEALDGRLPTLEDALAVLHVLHNYEPRLWESRFLLLEHLPAAGESPRYRLVHRAEVSFGEALDVSGWAAAGSLFMRARIAPTRFGRLAALLYQPAEIMLDAEYDGAGSRSFRFIPSLAGTPLLVSPLVESNDGVFDLWAGEPWGRLRRVAFRTTPRWRPEYAPRIAVELYDSPDFLQRIRLSAPLREELGAGRYPMLPVPPLRVESPFRPHAVEFDGSIGLVVHAPGAVVLPVPRAARGLAGAFGLAEGAYRGGGTTDGVEFAVEVTDARGKVRLAHVRTARPREREVDRGRLRFTIPLRGGDDREVTLRTRPGGSVDWDWAVWSDLRFE